MSPFPCTHIPYNDPPVFLQSYRKCSSKETWQWPRHHYYLVVGHEESTDGTVWLHFGHGCIILLFSHKVWGLCLPKVDQRLRPRLCFFHFLLNWWNLRQFLQNKAHKMWAWDPEKNNPGYKRSKHSKVSLILMSDRKPILSFKYILREAEQNECPFYPPHLQELGQIWWPDNEPPFETLPIPARNNSLLQFHYFCIPTATTNISYGKTAHICKISFQLAEEFAGPITALPIFLVSSPNTVYGLIKMY